MNVGDYVRDHIYGIGKIIKCYGNELEIVFKKSRIDGVYAGVICWWIDKDITKFIPIHLLYHMKQLGYKSIRYDDNTVATLSKPMQAVIIKGTKKRVFFDYDMEEFLEGVSK